MSAYIRCLTWIIITCAAAPKVIAGELIHHTKAWGNLVITGPLCNSKVYKYYYDTQLELEDDRYKFEAAYASIGVGYKTKPFVTLFLANTYYVAKQFDGSIKQEYRLWEQADWEIEENKRYSLTNRLRLEERKNFEQPQIALRIREKLILNAPIQNSKKYLVVVWDEMFFNLNHPDWVSKNFFAQNRAFIGLGIRSSKQSLFAIGYMNQYQINTVRQLSNILYASFNINFG